jgi:hypothetical protein
MFYGKTFGGGKKFTGNGLIAKLEASGETSSKDLNLEIGEFANADGKRYAMIVNLDRTRSVCLNISFPGKRTNVYSFRDGHEVSVRGLKQDGKNVTANKIWLAPAGEVVFHIDSAIAARAPITVEAPPSDNCPVCRKKLNNG